MSTIIDAPEFVSPPANIAAPSNDVDPKGHRGELSLDVDQIPVSILYKSTTSDLIWPGGVALRQEIRHKKHSGSN